MLAKLIIHIFLLLTQFKLQTHLLYAICFFFFPFCAFV
ncbi:hypothetical protein M128_4332 [Bacteroides fragilis str. S6L8]|nr:hypothetical protein M080_4016 [Bacteroides fragilis str. 3397 T10]EXY98542.1 hypothetical protein M074_4168 [Bacteroides fragilis str. DS-166]EXZ61280.1 hypothetical protein M107_4334 [Bacteroides fragilis str. 3725 D9(v)]EYA07312.1 hypothetical protein M130_4316 [Bacteroides fragilis str. S6R6]EYA98336.1 hypothetical protein M128_4332 [Bacteroides fragilis str. S6L8]EYE42910.1 hypothetical protein M127_4222 [Bacteroides fragilis str. S6L5]